MTEEVDRVFDATCALQWLGVDRNPQALRELLPIERPALHCQFGGALEKTPIKIVLDHAMTKIVQRTLRERRCGGTEPVEHHLPAQIDDGQVHSLSIGGSRIRLEQHRHGHERRRVRRFARSRVAIHGRELLLERFVEQCSAMQPQEAEQLLGPLHRLEDHLLLPGELFARLPSLHDRRPPRSSGSHRESVVDPQFARDRLHVTIRVPANRSAL
jgi:hypothetical protein